jgi:CheY-like chemotaxis protein
MMPHSVLRVDDDPIVLEVLVDMLEDLGCDVISAANGNDALDHLRQKQQISVLITDINMPGRARADSAREAAQVPVEGHPTIRSRAPNAPAIP